MPYMKFMSQTLVSIALLATSIAASAGLIRLDAITPDPNFSSSFSITFNDTGDGIFQIDELVSFTGFTAPGNPTWTTVAGLNANLPGIASPFGTCSFANAWCFADPIPGGQPTAAVSASRFTYNLTAVQAVPEPASIALVGLALAAAGIASRRRTG